MLGRDTTGNDSRETYLAKTWLQWDGQFCAIICLYYIPGCFVRSHKSNHIQWKGIEASIIIDVVVAAAGVVAAGDDDILSFFLFNLII